ncbi:MAG: NAD-dependent epimerase/dehydratase family protein [Gemmataceae bacterium]
MRVLITGGYGFIGSWIIRRLLARGDDVFVYDLAESPRRLDLILTPDQLARVVYVPGDVTDVARLTAAVGDHGITHVIHLAGLQVPICRADPILGAKVNVLGTLAVFEAAKAHQPAVRRVVYASSAAVFGPQSDYPRGGVGDDVKLTPTTHYGYFKCCNEGNARIYHQDHKLSSVGLRPWTVYGVGRDIGMTSEPTKAIKMLALGKPYHITYGGWQDLQYVDDVAGVFVRGLVAAYDGAKSYNLRGDVVDLATFHAALCQVAPEAEERVTFGTSQIGIAYDLSDDALRRDLGPIEKTPLVDGIRQTLELFRRLHAEGRLDVD